jgi:hypothetical protein
VQLSRALGAMGQLIARRRGDVRRLFAVADDAGRTDSGERRDADWVCPRNIATARF